MQAFDKIEQAIVSLRSGKPILLFDFPDREAETDLVMLGTEITWGKVDFLRRTAGAPMTVYLPYELASKLNLPLISTASSKLSNLFPLLAQLASGSRHHDALFTFPIDHRNNRTGCSAKESVYTIQRLAHFVDCFERDEASDLMSSFVREFRVPGHIPVIICAKDLLKTRKGHAELAMTIAEMGHLSRILVASEMIDSQTGESMNHENAILFAEEHKLLFIEGEEVYQKWKQL